MRNRYSPFLSQQIIIYRNLEHAVGQDNRLFDEIAAEEVAKYPTVRSGPVIFKDQDYYFPVPQAELDANPNMQQSTGYGGDGG